MISTVVMMKTVSTGCLPIKNLTGHKHRFTNDVQISIGDAHSGYPVMNSSFSTNSTTLPTTPLNDWLIWHEVGHNAAETPLTVPWRN